MIWRIRSKHTNAKTWNEMMIEMKGDNITQFKSKDTQALTFDQFTQNWHWHFPFWIKRICSHFHGSLKPLKLLWNNWYLSGNCVTIKEFSNFCVIFAHKRNQGEPRAWTWNTYHAWHCKVVESTAHEYFFLFY